VREDVHVLALPFTQLADELGDARAGNMVMLGALLEMRAVLPQASIDAALRRLVKNPRWWNWTSARWRGEGNCSGKSLRRCAMKAEAIRI
jgi:hypothetical protein